MSCTSVPTGQREVEYVYKDKESNYFEANTRCGRRAIKKWKNWTQIGCSANLRSAEQVDDGRTAITIGRALWRFIVFEDELEVEVIGMVLLESIERKELWKLILWNRNSKAVRKCQRCEWKLVRLRHYYRKSLMLIKFLTKDSFFNSNRGPISK